MTKKYDLEERTLIFARDVRKFVRGLLIDIAQKEDIKQVVRSSGSIGANYIEANENLGGKDFKMRIKISRKEAKETIYWLKLIDTFDNKDQETERQRLIQEGSELLKILSLILNKFN
ncbi:MAG: four helix bundle protein [bacterium]|nr:four helix bundle protein [bacterium]